MSRLYLHVKHFEFWNPRLFELPYYLYLLGGAMVRGLGIKDLARANYVLDHGEIGIGSKYRTQMAFDQRHFLPTTFLPQDMTVAEKTAHLQSFANQVGFPLILKSDIGSVGKGVVKVTQEAEIPSRVAQLQGPYLAQQFTPYNCEYGVFYVRTSDGPRITGINQKHFPTVVGDGESTLQQLAQRHPRFTGHWQTFLQYLDTTVVPSAGERVQLSFIGSHTMGCMFTDDTGLLTPELEQAVLAIFESQPGYNFGRLDLKAVSQEAFQSGKFIVIEVNGVASLPTHMFDPSYSVWQAWGIFLKHGRYLLTTASDNRHQPMLLSSYREIVRRVRENATTLDAAHQRLME